MDPDARPTSTADEEPPSHEVVHLVVDCAEAGAPHTHVVGVETATAGEPRRWRLVQFVEAYRLGERFYLGEHGPEIEPEVCASCAKVTIVTRGEGRAAPTPPR